MSRDASCASIGCCHPDFNGRAVGIEGGAYQRHFALHSQTAGCQERGRIAGLQRSCILLWDVRLAITEEVSMMTSSGCTRWRGFARIERPFSDDAIDGTLDLRVGKLRRRPSILALAEVS